MQDKLVLIVEDEAKLADILGKYLAQSGINSRIIYDGAEALTYLQQHTPDLVILDLMLPGMDGMTLCRKIRELGNTPIIMTTARVEEIDRILGLEIGADDYVCKPYSPREVVARVNAQFRRLEMNELPVTQHTGLTLDRERLSVGLGEQQTDLTLVEFRLLKRLMDRPGCIFSRNQLMDEVYQDGRIVSDRTIDSHIKKLRKKLAALGDSQEFIHSIYGVGYKLSC